jgi:hypothetical protein
MKANKIKSREASKITLLIKQNFFYSTTLIDYLKAMIDKATYFKDSMIGSIYVVLENAIQTQMNGKNLKPINKLF